MSENKRFEYIEATDWVDEHIIDHNTEPHFEYYYLKGATDKMNVLNDENQKLKEENEQLKSDLRYWRTLAQSLAKKNNVGDVE